MTKLALFSDIHANLEAFQACEEHAMGEGVDQFAVLGDHVGYGPDPERILDRLIDYQEKGHIVLLGNHDEACLTGPRRMSHHAKDAILWTIPRLQPEHLAFIASLPYTHEKAPLLLTHATAHEPHLWHYLNTEDELRLNFIASSQPITLAGHVHHQMLYFEDTRNTIQSFVPTPGQAIPLSTRRHWAATIGSLGQPRDGNNASQYAIYDDERHTLTFHRVPYDVERTLYKIYHRGLPAFLAERLARGQ
ncbi:calcineurin-like phosphoesterase superfamily domain protein [Ferrovum sp. JA12]|uniref:metallophosphoesterase family protein n=1 Tax=Ferrovum sp. JA12 TaxID=1356299 RepID=UPI00070392B1|nr:metallophosphoesterase family protein [Ferrovum sp. JA12]KRH78372.1 calcineurin-like phosphoesterase superfamily domain protein [Ferrovum sp. JA12]